MKKLLLTLAIGALWTAAIPVAAQTHDIQTVTVQANGTDIRQVLYQMFTQTKKSFVLEPGVHFALNLNLENVEFEEALQIICQTAHVESDVQDGIYYIGPIKSKAPKALPDAEAPAPIPARLNHSVLTRRVTMNLHKTPIAVVIAAISKETHVQIDLDSKVPGYRMDAVLHNVSLKSALLQITKAAHLQFAFTDHHSILVSPAPDDSVVAISN